MKRLLVLLTVLMLASIGRAVEAPRPILTLDAGGHTSDIHGIAFTPDGRTVLSASSDHTIRFWDVRTGGMLRVLRLPFYLDGAASKLALSPGGRLMAASLANPEKQHCIALIDLPGGTIVRHLDGHEGPIWFLTFSPSGKWIGSASRDGTARIWEASTGRCLHVLRGHRGPVTSLAFSPDSRKVATASYDETARIWSLDTGKVEATLRESDPRIYAMSGIAWSPDGRTLATGSLGSWIRLWNTDGTLRKRVWPNGPPRQMRFTSDSRALLYAGHGGQLIDLETGKHRASFTDHRGEFIWATALSPDEKIAATGGRSGEELYLWSTTDGKRIQHLTGRGRATWGVGWSADGQRLAWGNTFSPFDHRRPHSLTVTHPLERSFRLADLGHAGAPDASFRKLMPTWKGLTLERNPGNGWTTVREGEERLCTLKTTFSITGTFLPGERVAIGGYRDLALFEARSGEQIRTFASRGSATNSLAPSPDGAYLASTSGDQTLRIWKLDRSEPLLSLFFAGDEWIAWTEEGYYACSPGGERLMGWLVNNGPDRMATFHPAEKFRRTLYRPDVIQRILKEGSVEKALAVADAVRKKTTTPTTVAEALPPVVLITSPDQPTVTVKESTLEIRCIARTVSKHPIRSIRLLLNGRPYPGTVGLKSFSPPRGGTVRSSWTVKLPPGRYTFAVSAATEVSSALSESVEVLLAPRAMIPAPPVQDPDRKRPSLYVLAVGVSAYPAPYQLQYAARDAQVLAKTCQTKSRRLFGTIEARVLTDKEATRRAFLQGLAWVRKQATQGDVVVIFFGGHGVRDSDGTLYLLPVDGDPKELLASAVPADQIKQVLQGLPGKAVLLMDACHAGAIGGDRRRAIGGLTDDLIRDLVTDDYGVVVMCSSMGREYSLESEDVKHGFFTLALIEGLSGKGAKSTDGAVYLHHLEDYIVRRVKDLSGGRQHPVTARPTTIRTFPLSLPNGS